ncbi:MAG: GNAT family N-acetyltransferase [Acidimicrobiales bacterium]
MTASRPTYAKVPFEWTSANEVALAVGPGGAQWTPAGSLDELVDVVRQVLEVSRDAADSWAVARFGARDAAQRLIRAPGEWKCSYDENWWKILTVDGEAAGFVLPVTYDELDGSLGTIFHTGVVPRFRGLGLSRLLLRQAVNTLMTAGVQRIFCDTDATNEPMIRSFTSEGWTRLPPRDVPVPLDFTPGARDPGE